MTLGVTVQLEVMSTPATTMESVVTAPVKLVTFPLTSAGTVTEARDRLATTKLAAGLGAVTLRMSGEVPVPDQLKCSTCIS